jgi:glycine/D-amino acid oxidase-like deaminating enzyme
VNTRLAIIGAGAAGVSAAARAAELGARVTLFERKSPAAASSGLSAGVFNAQTTNPLDIELRIRTREVLFRLETERGLHLAKIGGLRFATNGAELQRLHESLKVQRELGIDDAKLLTRQQIQALVPDLKCDDVIGGIHGPNEGHVDGHMFCNAMVDEARSRGATLRNNCEITGYRKTAGGHRLTTADGSEAEFDVIINAAGAWAGKVGEMLGHAAPVRPEVHEVVIAKFAKRLPYVVPYCQFYFPGQQGEGVYFRQEAVDTLVCGLHTYDSIGGLAVQDFDHYQPQHGEDYLTAVAEKVYERLPIDDLGFKSGWFGLYPLSADGKFQIGPYEADPTVVVAAGLGGVGLASGACIGACAAEWAVLGKLTTMPRADAYRPDRPSLAGLW